MSKIKIKSKAEIELEKALENRGLKKDSNPKKKFKRVKGGK